MNTRCEDGILFDKQKSLVWFKGRLLSFISPVNTYLRWSSVGSIVDVIYKNDGDKSEDIYIVKSKTEDRVRFYTQQNNIKNIIFSQYPDIREFIDHVYLKWPICFEYYDRALWFYQEDDILVKIIIDLTETKRSNFSVNFCDNVKASRIDDEQNRKEVIKYFKDRII